MVLDTFFAQQTLNHYTKLTRAGLLRLNCLEQMIKEKIEIEKLTITKEIFSPPATFSIDNLHSEIRKNILNCPDDTRLKKYFHYLIKIHWSMNEMDQKLQRAQKHLKTLKYYKEKPIFSFNNFRSKYVNVDELYGHCNYLLKSAFFDGLKLHFIILEEFRYNIDKWKEYIAKKGSITPSLKDVEALFDESIEANTDELLPEYDFNGEITKIAWLHELGILEIIMNRCKHNETSYNVYKAANIIHTFTGIKAETIRRSLEAIFKPTATNKKNHPLTNINNVLFVEGMKTKFRLSQPK